MSDCPNVVTSDEGTSFCALAEQAWRDKDAEVTALRTQLDEAVRLLRAEHLGLIDGEEANYAKDCTSCKFLRAAALNKEEA